MGKRGVVWLIVAAMLVLAVGGGLWWYLAVPHTPEAQFAFAEKMEKALRAEAVGKPGSTELTPKIDTTEREYQKVGARFGKGPKAAEALKRIAKIDEEVAKDLKRALSTLEELRKDYADEDNAGYALIEQARLIRLQAEALKADGKAEAEATFHQAISKLEEFRKAFAGSKRGDEALMEIGRIWQDGLENPPIHSIEAFEQVLKDYPHSIFEPEALYRLAKEYEKITQFDRALQLYARLIEEYPKSQYAADATFARGKLLADQMDKHDEAAKEFEKMAQNFPDDPRASAAGQEARSEKARAAQEKGESYGKSRYGGGLPYDTSGDKPIPPAELLAKFIAQKLDAENYDLDVTFAPADQKITVKGTLKLMNRGADKNELLLMLGPGMTDVKMKMDGADATTQHKRDTLLVTLPAALKKDSETTLAFEYSGQYASPDEIRSAFAGGRMEQRSSAPPPRIRGMDWPNVGPPAASKYALDPQIGLGDFGYALSGASWYPVTIIGDIFQAHLVLHTPANLEAVANGELVKREKSEKQGIDGNFEFRTKSPVFGLYFAYGPYVMHERTTGDIHFYTYLRPENTPKSDAYIDVANRILSFYSSKFAGFPFEKMALIETPLPPFLAGVGPASLMFVNDGMVAHPEVPENLLAHELAHQWFGNLIPINLTDPGYNQWLSEGFATYCDALYTEHKDGPKAFAIHIQQYQQLYFQFSLMSKPPAIRDTMNMASPMYRPIVYEKGALVLHMLRKVMGDEKFFRLMKQYVETYRNKLTTTDDFRRMASDINGADLSWFFAEWYDASIFAHWKVNAMVTPDAKGAGATTRATITQPDDLVKMPADVTFLGAHNERQVTKDVMLDKKENIVEAKTPFVPVKVIVDEDNWVLKRLGEDNIWSSTKATVAR